jgi:HAD superfamily hydrolase (TIGR01458 family)
MEPELPQDARVAADAEPRLRRALTAALPALAPAEVITTIAGVYDVTPDWHPMLGPWPGVDGLYLAVGFSGHGLKLAPAVGEAVADELAGRTPAIDISLLRPAAPPGRCASPTGPGHGPSRPRIMTVRVWPRRWNQRRSHAGDLSGLPAKEAAARTPGRGAWGPGFTRRLGYGRAMARIGAVLIDIDGVLTVSWQPLEGAVAALRRLRAAALPLALVTNTTSRTRASIAAALAGAGFPVTAADILTAPVIAASYLREHCPGARCLLLNDGDIGEDLAGVTLARADDPAVDVVLLGGAGPQFSYQALNRAFGHLQRGARLVAMHRGLYWRTADGLQLDSGAFVAGLEQAAGTEAEVVGKPAPAFFAAALAHLGAGAAGTLMVGADIENDVLAAQRQGLTGALVKTGKYLPRALKDASGPPDHVLGSFADVPELMDRLS